MSYSHREKNRNPLSRRVISILSAVGVILLLAGTLSTVASQPATSPDDQDGKVSFSPGETLELEELLRFAAANSPDLRSAHAKWKAAREEVPQAASLPDPRLTYGYFFEEVETRTGPQEQKVGISQTFPWFGKLSIQEEMAIREAKAAYQDYMARRLRLARQIKSDFHEYAYLAQAIKINREHLELLKVMEAVATMRFKAGRLPQSTLIQTQVEQGKIEDRVKELETLRVPLSSRIHAAMGVKDARLLPWPGTTGPPLPSLDKERLRASLLKENPSLRKIGLLREKADYSVKLARKNYYPDITLGVERIDIDGGDDPTIATVSITLPIWRDRLNASKREAIKRRESIEDTLANSEHQLSAQLDLLLYYFHDAERKTGLYRNTLIPKAQQAIDVALTGFETGKVSFADLLDAERSLLEFQLTGERQFANAHKRLAEIEALIGKELPIR